MVFNSFRRSLTVVWRWWQMRHASLIFTVVRTHCFWNDEPPIHVPHTYKGNEWTDPLSAATYCKGEYGHMSLYIHVPFPATTFSIKGLILAVTVSLWAEINCNRSPNLKTKLLLWTMTLPFLHEEYFKIDWLLVIFCCKLTAGLSSGISLSEYQLHCHHYWTE